MADPAQGKENPINGETTLRLWKAAHAGGKRERDAFIARIYNAFAVFLKTNRKQRRKLAAVGLEDLDEIRSLVFAGIPSRQSGVTQGLLQKLDRVDPNTLNGGAVCYAYLRTAFTRQVATVVRAYLRATGELMNETGASSERWGMVAETRSASSVADDSAELRSRITEAAGVRTIGPDGELWTALLDALLAGKSPTFDVVPEAVTAVLGGSAYAVYLRSIVKLNRAAALVAGNAV